MTELETDGLPIETPSLILRRLDRSDAGRLFALSLEAAYQEWLPSQVYANEAEAEEALDFLIGQFASPGNPSHGAYVLAVDHRADGRLIGHVGFSPLDDEVEIGYAIAAEYQGKGLGTEAVVAACRWVRERFGLARVIAVTAEANAASRALLERAGFLHEEDRVMKFQGADQRVSLFAIEG